MKRWRVAFLVALLAALPVLLSFSRSPGLLQDSDTKGILAGIRTAQDPLKWFRGDWPIENHFYRPISALTFEADNALWRDNAAGYGFTNALLCFTSILLLFWLLRELTDRPWLSAAGTVVFALWHAGPISTLSVVVFWGAWLTLAVGVFRHRRAWRSYIPAFLTLLALSRELLPIRSLFGRMIDWVPGRTASTMTVFALLALAAYARYERLRLQPIADPITPETPPATRNTRAPIRTGSAAPWAVAGVLGTALALGSYEQAVMLPAVLLVIAAAFRIRGGKPNWALHGIFWGLILGYLVLRWQLLPHTASGYQAQQYSSTRTAFWNEMEYLFPALAGLFGIPSTLSAGALMLLTAQPYTPLADAAVVATGYWHARRETVLFLVGWLGSAIAFAPMAWFKLFEHYHYWPMALRAAFVVGMGVVALRLAAIAWCPPARSAPPRPSPAPGSLPHP
ncbi:hypothetical protein EON82_13880 [bacterium]|nr:MAG: hypothetical protein EON82_13880 [bacterium]